LVSQSKFAQAVSVWRQFLDLYPNNAEAHASLARIYIMQKQFGEAIQEYLTAADIEENNPDYYTRAANLYMNNGKAAEAVRLWQKAIENNPHTAGIAYFRLGKYYETQGSWLDALNHNRIDCFN